MILKHRYNPIIKDTKEKKRDIIEVGKGSPRKLLSSGMLPKLFTLKI